VYFEAETASGHHQEQTIRKIARRQRSAARENEFTDTRGSVRQFYSDASSVIAVTTTSDIIRTNSPAFRQNLSQSGLQSRGYAIERLQSLAGNKMLAALLPLTVFAVAHYRQGPGGIIAAFVLGGVFTVFYMKFRDLLANITALPHGLRSQRHLAARQRRVGET
jgi:hypothetical protein